MLRPLILSLALSASALSAPALADCLPEGTQPSKLTFNSGAVIEILGRDGDVLRYRQTIIETGKQTEMTVHAGIFTLTALRDGEGARFDWSTGLPAVADLVPGASFQEEAMLTTPGGLPPRPFTTDVQVIGPEEITVAGCTYSALKVVVVNREGNKPIGEVTKWLHPDTLISLRSEVKEGDNVRVQEVVVME